MSAQALGDLRDRVDAVKIDTVRLDGRVKSIEAYIAEQKSNRLWLIGLTIGIVADVVINLFFR